MTKSGMAVAAVSPESALSLDLRRAAGHVAAVSCLNPEAAYAAAQAAQQALSREEGLRLMAQREVLVVPAVFAEQKPA